MLMRFEYDASILDECLVIGLPGEWRGSSVHISASSVQKYDEITTTQCLFTLVNESNQGYITIDFASMIDKDDMMYLKSRPGISIIIELCATGNHNDLIVFCIDFRSMSKD